ncbi:MAG: molybdate ABC transporter substrate-binding protein [Methylovulum sp.]|nr:molybdate ABC transporter substrate-binding protein [Methylovulum sp.]
MLLQILKRLLLLMLVVLLPTANVLAGQVLVAVASNFAKPMEEIALEFKKTTGHSAELSFGASGKFVAQIENGAPFQVFLSADEKKPEKLTESGFAVAGTQFTYALGKLVLWSAKLGYIDAEGKVLSAGNYKHLAIADPKLAPYGAAALEVLNGLGLEGRTKPLLVLGENISQTQQFICTGNAELGFIALSQVIKDGKIGEGSGWIVPADNYALIRQDAILLKTGADNPAAKALLDFLASDKALSIIEKYGYGLAKGKP